MPSTVEKPLSDVLGYSLQCISKLHEENEKHIEQVYNLSMQLFKQLRVLHKFPRQYIKVLRVAATMYGSGRRVRCHNYPKHSYYMILSANLYGVAHKDIVLAAFIVASFSSDGVNVDELVKYKDLLTEEDIDAIKRLGVILKIAISLDRSMAGAIRNLNCDVLGDSVIRKTETHGDASLDDKEAMSVDGEFRKAFKKNLEIL
jgi:exopolyphosphatase/guanosine-5'-triphosphate,3'-diphosphate pyrophosphatase